MLSILFLGTEGCLVHTRVDRITSKICFPYRKDCAISHAISKEHLVILSEFFETQMCGD